MLKPLSNEISIPGVVDVPAVVVVAAVVVVGGAVVAEDVPGNTTI